jgi:hypothetical protein
MQGVQVQETGPNATYYADVRMYVHGSFDDVNNRTVGMDCAHDME